MGVSDAKQQALRARSTMLAVRSPDVGDQVPEGFTGNRSRCVQYFETAAVLYAQAAEAYAQGDFVTGQIYEGWAHQSLVLGQACEASTG